MLLLVAVVALCWLRPQTPLPSFATPASARHQAPVGSPLSGVASDATPPTVLAQFERLGVARDVVVHALLGEIHRRWDLRSAELEKRYAPSQVPEREYIELARMRDADEVRMLKEALGESEYLAWHKDHTLRMLNVGGAPLTPQEAELAYRLQKEFNEEYNARQMAMEDGVADEADLGRLHDDAQAALDRQLEQLLGTQRYQQMRGISDPIADVQRRFGDLDPTPDQAHIVLQAEEHYLAREAALAKRLKADASDTAEIAVELQAMREARDQELRRTFGAEAYDALQRQNDPTFKKLTQYAAAWELQDHEIPPLHEALHAFHVQTERTRAAAAMREAAGHPVNWPEINAAIEQSRRQTEATLSKLIGEPRLDRLKQNGMLYTP